MHTTILAPLTRRQQLRVARLLALALLPLLLMRTSGQGPEAQLPSTVSIGAGWLRTTIGNYAIIATLDNHYVVGGQGEYLLAAVARLGLAGERQVVQFGVREIPL